MVTEEHYARVISRYSGSEHKGAAGGSCEGLRMGERAQARGLVAGTRKAWCHAMHRQEVDVSLPELPYLPAEEAAPDAQLRPAPVVWPVPGREVVEVRVPAGDVDGEQVVPRTSGAPGCRNRIAPNRRSSGAGTGISTGVLARIHPIDVLQPGSELPVNVEGASRIPRADSA